MRDSATQSRYAAIVCSFNSYGHCSDRAEFISHVTVAENKIRDIHKRNTSDVCDESEVLKFHKLLKFSLQSAHNIINIHIIHIPHKVPSISNIFLNVIHVKCKRTCLQK